MTKSFWRGCNEKGNASTFAAIKVSKLFWRSYNDNENASRKKLQSKFQHNFGGGV